MGHDSGHETKKVDKDAAAPPAAIVIAPVTLREKTGIWIIPRLNLERIGGRVQTDGNLADWRPELFQEVLQPAELLNKSDAWKAGGLPVSRGSRL